MKNEKEITNAITHKITNINETIDSMRDELYKVQLYISLLKDFVSNNNEKLSSEFKLITQKIDNSIKLLNDKSYILEINKLKKIIRSNSGKIIEVSSPNHNQQFFDEKQLTIDCDFAYSLNSPDNDIKNNNIYDENQNEEIIVINKQSGSPILVKSEYIDRDDFNVNIFTNKKILCSVVLEIFKKNFDFESIDININSFKYFVLMVSNYYHNNPYHNFYHAVSVLQFVHLIANKLDIKKYLLKFEIFGLFIAALVHDIDHPGHTNLFEINNKSHLALKYNDKSVLENHHCSLAFYLIHMKDVQLLKNLDQINFSIVRETIVECILSTDMKNHHDLIKGLEDKFYNYWDWNNVQDRLLFLKTLIHIADLSNQVKIFDVAFEGSIALKNEFAIQIAIEEKLNLPSQEFMKINNDKTFYNTEYYFSSNIVKPMWNILIEMFPELIEFYNNLNENINKWKEMANNC